MRANVQSQRIGYYEWDNETAASFTAVTVKASNVDPIIKAATAREFQVGLIRNLLRKDS
jgi:hypothetical protein